MSRLTQRQIKESGATKYMTSRIVKGLKPCDQQGRQYLYLIEDVIKSIEKYALAPRIREKTRTMLYILMKKISELDSVSLPGNQLYELERELRDALIGIKKTFAEGHCADRENEKAKRKSERARFNHRRKKIRKEKLPSLIPVGEIIPVDFRKNTKVNK